MTLISNRKFKSYGREIEQCFRRAEELRDHLEESSREMAVLSVRVEQFIIDFSETHKVDGLPPKVLQDRLAKEELTVLKREENVISLTNQVLSEIEEVVRRTDRPGMNQIQKKLLFFCLDATAVDVSKKALEIGRKYLHTAYKQLRGRTDLYQQEIINARQKIATGLTLFSVFERQSSAESSIWSSLRGLLPGAGSVSRSQIREEVVLDPLEYTLTKKRPPGMSRAFRNIQNPSLIEDDISFGATLEILLYRKGFRELEEGSQDNCSLSEVSSCLSSRSKNEGVPEEDFSMQSDLLDDEAPSQITSESSFVDGGVLSEEDFPMELNLPDAGGLSQIAPEPIFLDEIASSEEEDSECEGAVNASPDSLECRFGVFSHFFPLFNQYQLEVGLLNNSKEECCRQRRSLEELLKQRSALRERFAKKETQEEKDVFLRDVASCKEALSQCIDAYFLYFEQGDKLEVSIDEVHCLYKQISAYQIDPESRTTLKGLRFPSRIFNKYDALLSNFSRLITDLESHFQDFNTLRSSIAKELNATLYDIFYYERKISSLGVVGYYLGKDYLKEELRLRKIKLLEEDLSLKLLAEEKIERALAF